MSAIDCAHGVPINLRCGACEAETMAYPDGNPKTAMGAKKPDLSVIPPTALLHMATAMMNGAEKYGPFNWRELAVSTRPYIAAAQRHLLAYLDGEEFSSDTTEIGLPVHHLAHVMACCAILLDAGEVGTLNDNRPLVGRAGAMIEEYNRCKRFGAAVMPTCPVSETPCHTIPCPVAIDCSDRVPVRTPDDLTMCPLSRKPCLGACDIRCIPQ